MSYVGSDALFATHVAKYNRPDLLTEIDNAFSQYKDENEKDWSYNMTENIYVLNKHKELQKELVDVASDFLTEKMQYDCEIQMTTSWFTRTRKGDYNTNMHNHHNAWWSGVYYMQDDCAIQIIGRNTVIMVKQKEFNLHSCPHAVYKPNKGEILLFPASTDHMVIHKEKAKVKKMRYSLAFNFMPKGLVGDSDSSFCY